MREEPSRAQDVDDCRQGKRIELASAHGGDGLAGCMLLEDGIAKSAPDHERQAQHDEARNKCQPEFASPVHAEAKPACEGIQQEEDWEGLIDPSVVDIRDAMYAQSRSRRPRNQECTYKRQKPEPYPIRVRGGLSPAQPFDNEQGYGGHQGEGHRPSKEELTSCWTCTWSEALVIPCPHPGPKKRHEEAKQAADMGGGRSRNEQGASWSEQKEREPRNDGHQIVRDWPVIARRGHAHLRSCTATFSIGLAPRGKAIPVEFCT